ncbi:unnamed protein product, partial [Protopolystoma xenopodis]
FFSFIFTCCYFALSASAGPSTGTHATSRSTSPGTVDTSRDAVIDRFARQTRPIGLDLFTGQHTLNDMTDTQQQQYHYAQQQQQLLLSPHLVMMPASGALPTTRISVAVAPPPGMLIQPGRLDESFS